MAKRVIMIKKSGLGNLILFESFIIFSSLITCLKVVITLAIMTMCHLFFCPIVFFLSDEDWPPGLPFKFGMASTPLPILKVNPN